MKCPGDGESPSSSSVTFSNGEITLATVSAQDYKTCHSKQPSGGGLLCNTLEFNTTLPDAAGESTGSKKRKKEKKRSETGMEENSDMLDGTGLT